MEDDEAGLEDDDGAAEVLLAAPVELPVTAEEDTAATFAAVEEEPEEVTLEVLGGELLEAVEGGAGGAASRAARLLSYTLSTPGAPQVSGPPAVACCRQPMKPAPQDPTLTGTDRGAVRVREHGHRIRRAVTTTALITGLRAVHRPSERTADPSTESGVVTGTGRNISGELSRSRVLVAADVVGGVARRRCCSGSAGAIDRRNIGTTTRLCSVATAWHVAKCPWLRNAQRRQRAARALVAVHDTCRRVSLVPARPAAETGGDERVGECVWCGAEESPRPVAPYQALLSAIRNA